MTVFYEQKIVIVEEDTGTMMKEEEEGYGGGESDDYCCAASGVAGPSPRSGKSSIRLTASVCSKTTMPRALGNMMLCDAS